MVNGGDGGRREKAEAGRRKQDDLKVAARGNSEEDEEHEGEGFRGSGEGPQLLSQNGNNSTL